jgi:hypothetical protein
MKTCCVTTTSKQTSSFAPFDPVSSDSFTELKADIREVEKIRLEDQLWGKSNCVI